VFCSATLVIDLDVIETNARILVGRLRGIDVTAVTKVTCSEPRVAQALIRGGVTSLADSRLGNIARLRDAGVAVPVWLIRSPQPLEALDTVRLADVSLNSELETIRALDVACRDLGRRHGILLMVELGDLREGVLPADLLALVHATLELKHVRLEGIGVNLACFAEIMPSEENLGRLVELARQAEEVAGRPLVVSGGNSSSIDLALSKRLPRGITNLRIGYSMLFGLNRLTNELLLPGELEADAFTVRAPVIECNVKPSLPVGVAMPGAHVTSPIVDRGLRRRAICAIGYQDIVPEGLVPLDPRIQVLNATGDHLVLDVDDLDEPLALGQQIGFRPSYRSVLRASASPYVEKTFCHSTQSVAARGFECGSRGGGDPNTTSVVR
jgi:ornithine racemase